ncbi:transient receptor potential channel pyrexia-like isoform X1 [Cydia fagiglandana]|uniref:transient receptor potential channel pyrexia-like isoform X1 n=1 Tax=Cydia fagiglandana TaxID=1458189 RepID=UPI002FEE3B13
MDSMLSDADAEAGMHEVDCVPLLPLSDSIRDRILPKQYSTESLKGLSSFYGIDSARRTSDATEVYQCQRKYASENAIRPRFNTVTDVFTDEIRRLRARLDTRLHEAVIDQDISEIVRLISNGASPAALDHSGLTPLHLCIRHKLIKPFQALLQHKDSANVRDARGLSVLHVAVLHRWLPGVEAALAAGADVTALCDASKPLLSHSLNCERYQHVSYEDFVLAFVQTPIQLATKVGDLAILLKLLDVAERMGVVDCHNKKGQTPLYTAIMNGNLEAVEIFIKKGALVDNVSKRRETALHIAVRKPAILKYLLDNTNCPSSFSEYGYAPIHKAAYCNKPESAKLLLNKFNNIELKTVSLKNNVTEEKSGGFTALHMAAKYFSNETGEVLLEMGANPNEVDDLGNTPLHVAAKTMNRTMSEILLRNGAVLSAKDQDGNSALRIIATKFHDALSFFELVFDEFVCTKGLYPMGTTVVCVNYEVLSRSSDSRQIKAIEEFVSCGMRKILMHPFIESLLYLKWRQLLPIFYVLMTAYALFLVSFNIFVVNVFYCKDNMVHANISESPSNRTKSSAELPWFEMFDKWYYLLLALIYVSISLLGLQESFYIYLKRLHYFDSLESWVKLTGLILAAILPLTVHFVEMAAWQRHVACAALLLVWLQAMFLLSRFPGWGYYVLMFGKVAINMFKVFITSICLVVGFAFCFMIQFQSEPPFDGPISAVVKTLIMMSSEFDYEDLFGQAHDKQLQDSRTIVRLLFLVFVIFVAIVLVNFMIAVAVSDINNLNIAGNISRLEKQVELLSSLDVLVNCGPLSRMFKKKYGGKRYHKKMYNSIKANRTWFVECSSSVEMYPQVLPSALYRAIIEIARKKDERFMKSNVRNTSKTKLDAVYDAIIGGEFGIDTDDKEKENNTYWLRETILKQNEKINQLQCDILVIKEMLADMKVNKNVGERISL